MEKEPEQLQFLGVFGIVSEAFNILRSCAKLLGAITRSLLLPLSLLILSHSLISDRFFPKKFLSLEWAALFLFEAAYFTLVLAFSLLSTAAVVYTVASIDAATELSYARVMSVVPRVWKRLVWTFVWYFVAMSARHAVVEFATFLWIVLLNFNKLQPPSFNLGLLAIATVSFSVNVYLSMIWQVASVVSVVEEKQGLGAMKKSQDLIKGKRVTAMALAFFYLLTLGIIEWVFDYAVVHGEMQEVGVGGRSVYGVMVVVVQCAVHLTGLLLQSVFYFVCKSYHQERIDESGLSDHLEAYLGEYMPLKNNRIQLEHCNP